MAASGRILQAYHANLQDFLRAIPQQFTRGRWTETGETFLEYALWTLAIIRELIRRDFGVKLSEVSVGRLMRRLGFTLQRPLYRAWQQNPVLVDQWKAEEYPKIAARAKRTGALIFFADESGIRSDYHAGTTWGTKGQTPIVKATGKRYSMNMLSAVNALGHFRFMTVDGRVNGAVFRDFLDG